MENTQRMELPRIASYGHYSSDNYGVNCLSVTLPGFTLYYSYTTIVAYWDYTDGVVACQNVWGTTTGKHLNWIEPDHDRRKDYDTFQAMAWAMLERHLVAEPKEAL